MPARTSDTPQPAALSEREPARVSAQIRAFASTQRLGHAELIEAPVRWPRPSRLQRPLEIPGKKMLAGMRSLGLETVGDLLEHLPSDSREARTVKGLRAGE